MKLFLLEATMLALIGTLLGIAGSVSMELVINALQLTWFPPGGSENLSLTVSVFREFGMVVIALMMAVVFSTLAAVPAANKAARLKIVDALRFT
jgi:putative ABC transport system permease protein